MTRKIRVRSPDVVKPPPGGRWWAGGRLVIVGGPRQGACHGRGPGWWRACAMMASPPTPTPRCRLSRLSRLGSPPSGPVPGNEYTSCRNICEESLIVRCAWALVGRGWALAGLRGAAPRRINNYMETSPAPCQLRLPPSCQERRSTREGFDERRAQNLIVLLLSLSLLCRTLLLIRIVN